MESKILLPSPSFNKNSSVIKNQQKSSNAISDSDSCKLLLPKPKLPTFKQITSINYHRPHFSSPNGMLLPSSLQPPPMYGPRGATLPPKYMKNYQKNNNKFIDPQPKFTDNNFNINEEVDKKFWCDVCDQLFPNQTQLDRHKTLHRSCSFENCNFIGVSETLDAHLEQHNSGAYDKIRNLNTPEEIEKWKAERKKNYPTIVNVELRRKALAAKMTRGEKLSENKARFGKSQDRKQMRADNKHYIEVEKKVPSNNVKDKKTRKRKRKHNSDKLINATINEEKIKPTDNNYIENRMKFNGTSFFKDYKIEVENNKSNPLSNLLGMYGTSTDEDSNDGLQSKKDCETVIISKVCNNPEKDINIVISKTKDVSNDNANQVIPTTEIQNRLVAVIENSENNLSEVIADEKYIYNDSLNEEVQESSHNDVLDEDMPEEQPIIREDLLKSDKLLNATIPTTSVIVVHKNPSSKTNLKLKPKILKKPVFDYSKLRKFRRQYTVLSKLLEKDIRHERNLLLQCVRYVIDNNFFGIDAKK